MDGKNNNQTYSFSVLSENASVVNTIEKQMKIIMVGDAAVGKSSLLERYLRGEFYEGLSPTVGVEFGMKSIEIDNENIKAGIWDTTGQEKFRHLTTSYFRNAQGAFLVFDVTNILSFKNIPEWAKMVNEKCAQGAIKVLIANKIDDVKKTEFKKENAHLDELLKEYNIDKFFEMSAKENTNVETGFKFMIETVKRKILDLAQDPIPELQSQKTLDNRLSNDNLKPRALSAESFKEEQKKKCC